MNRIAFLCSLFVFLGSCGEAEPTANAADGDAAIGVDEGAGHGAALDLGHVKLVGLEMSVTRFGELVPGVEGAIEVAIVDGAEVDGDLRVFLWVENRAGDQLMAPSSGHAEGGHLHFHVNARKGSGDPYRVVLRARLNGADERASLPLDGHGHEHLDTPHEGVVAPFASSDGKTTGHLELKLHDDKGDLELWLARDEAISQPFDLPLDTAVTVKFIDVGNREVALAVRNRETNEDEGGDANILDGRTHYFIYPSQPGVDASWLQGETFQSIVEVSWTADGQTYRSNEFVLVPHTHH